MLVRDHADQVPLSGETHHGAEEIMSMRGIDPGGPQDDVARRRLAHCALARFLAAAIDAPGATGSCSP